jgi:hypothetical protein
MNQDQSASQLDYQTRCERAATAQGLDPIADELWRVGTPYNVANLGGFCMGITVTDGPHVAVVTTWDCAEGRASVGLYEVDQWEDGGEPIALHDVPQVDVPELVAALLGGVK